MARYERDYGRDFGRWANRGSNPGGGRQPDSWGGWGGYGSEPGGYGTGWEGTEGGYQSGFGGGFAGGQPGYGRGADFERRPQGGYGGPFEYDRGYGRGQAGWQPFESGQRGGLGAGTAWDFDRDAFPQSGGYRGGYGGFNARSGYAPTRGWETGYGGTNLGYGEGWQDRGSWGSQRERGFGRSRASEIMTENPETVTPDASLADVARKMRDLDVGIIPVVDAEQSRRLRGVITDRDIAIRAIAEGKDGRTTVKDCMTERVRSVNKNDSINEVMRVMREEQVRRVPVTDREGRLVGIIAQADLAVDFAGGQDTSREIAVGETLERISEPAQPDRSATRMAAAPRSTEPRASERSSETT